MLLGAFSLHEDVAASLTAVGGLSEEAFEALEGRLRGTVTQEAFFSKGRTNHSVSLLFI